MKDPKNDNSNNQYIRVGDDYFKLITYTDKNKNIIPNQLAFRKRQTILDDFNMDFLKTIPRYDSFVNVPYNKGEVPIFPTNYNLYFPFQYKPMKGSWTWSEHFIKHIFGEQYELGLDYIQLLYEQPTQMLPILCLVSKENETGKTTFVDWLVHLFYGNAVIIGSQDVHGDFNDHFISKLIIAVDESKIDKQTSLEKIKHWSTQQQAFFHAKWQGKRTIDFIGKIILLSNYEDNFITARDEDIRYWIRKLQKPKEYNFKIIDDLKNEIPAFIHFLDHRTLSTKQESRMWFHPKDLETKALEVVRESSKSWLYKDLFEYFKEHFSENENLISFKASPTDIKSKWFERNSNVQVSYIRKILKDEFNLQPSEKDERYVPFGVNLSPSKVGTPFTIEKSFFNNTKEIVNTNVNESNLLMDNVLVENNLPF
ncbi:MAG: DUF5906 domain-containing protein [Bacteroidales bacterium]|nr:DUF5906 domain-containing protein [Bacteroidales bacterium]